MSTPQAKFRPSFTLAEVQYLIGMLENHQNPVAVSLLVKLRLLAVKVDLGATSPAYITSPRASIEEKLGIELTPAQKREAAYIKYQGAPGSCSDLEVALAKAYMYNNNMMTPEEEAVYEAQFTSD